MILKALLFSLVSFHSLAAPRNDVVATCVGSNAKVKTQIELKFEGKLRSDGRPYEVFTQEMVIRTYEQNDQGKWTAAKGMNFYFVSNDEDRVVSQFFAKRPIQLVNAVVTQQKGWNMDYMNGSMGMEVPGVFGVIATVQRTRSSDPMTFGASFMVYSKNENTLIRNFMTCEQNLPKL